MRILLNILALIVSHFTVSNKLLFTSNKIDISLLLALNNKNICRSISTKLHYLNTIVFSINCIDLWAWLDKITSWCSRLCFTQTIYVFIVDVYGLYDQMSFDCCRYTTQQTFNKLFYYLWLLIILIFTFCRWSFSSPFIKSNVFDMFSFLRFPFDPPLSVIAKVNDNCCRNSIFIPIWHC